MMAKITHLSLKIISDTWYMTENKVEWFELLEILVLLAVLCSGHFSFFDEGCGGGEALHIF